MKTKILIIIASQLILRDLKDARTRPEKVQITGPSLSTITPYNLIFIKIEIGVLERA